MNHLSPLIEVAKTVANSNLTSLENTFLAFQVITSICIIILSSPQLIKVLKEKNTGNISFLSF